MPIYYQSANPIPICGQSVNPLPIRQSLTNLPISDQSIYPMPTLDQADMTVFQQQPLHTHICHNHWNYTVTSSIANTCQSYVNASGRCILIQGTRSLCWTHLWSRRRMISLRSQSPICTVFFSILDNICQSTANLGPTYQCNANLLNNANANATQSYQSIINLPTNALIHSTSQIH